MAVDQVELLTRDSSRSEVPESTDAQQFLESLPVQTSAESIRDIMVKETDPAEAPGGRMLQATLTGLSWAMYVFAVGAVLALTWAVIRGI
jgi:hypothetical protein